MHSHRSFTSANAVMKWKRDSHTCIFYHIYFVGFEVSLHVDHPLSALQPGECIGFISRPVRSLAVVADPITACDTVLTVFLVSYNCILGISSPAKQTINIPWKNMYMRNQAAQTPFSSCCGYILEHKSRVSFICTTCFQLMTYSFYCWPKGLLSM